MTDGRPALNGLKGRALRESPGGFYLWLAMKLLDRITMEPGKMGGRPCIRGLRLTVGTITGLLAARKTREEILSLYPMLEDDDITAALEFVTRLASDQEHSIKRA